MDKSVKRIQGFPIRVVGLSISNVMEGWQLITPELEECSLMLQTQVVQEVVKFMDDNLGNFVTPIVEGLPAVTPKKTIL